MDGVEAPNIFAKKVEVIRFLDAVIDVKDNRGTKNVEATSSDFSTVCRVQADLDAGQVEALSTPASLPPSGNAGEFVFTVETFVMP